MFPVFLIAYAASIFYAASGESEPGGEEFGKNKKGNNKPKKPGKHHGKKKQKEDQQGQDEDSGGDESDPLEKANEEIDLAFDLDEVGDEVSSTMFFDEDDDDVEIELDQEEEFGSLPSGPPSGAQVLRSAGLAQPGSWTERNVLQAGARDSWSRRVAGNASEADFAVLRAARPGIASSASGYINPAWTKARWPGDGGESSADGALEDVVLEEMGLL